MSEDNNNIKELIRKMFEKQNELNIHTNGADWKTNKDLKWYRAIWTECAELLDYTNWKWWRKQDVSFKDIEMEVIDIWHFAMSDMMSVHSMETCIEKTYSHFESEFESQGKVSLEMIQKRTETFAGWILINYEFSLDSFIKLCSCLNMGIDDIYKLYMGKNVLNKFRQDNGYKQKTYIKIWNGQEDNIYLMKFLENIEVIDNDFEEKIYRNLETTYNNLTSAEPRYFQKDIH